MSIAIGPEAVTAEQSIRLALSRLGAGFQHMQALAAELASLDAVGQDIRHTQAMIRRDAANTVLQTAFSMKSRQDVVPDPGEVKASNDAVETVSDAHAADQWTKRLLRWADRLGRDLFGSPSARSRIIEENRTLLPPQKR